MKNSFLFCAFLLAFFVVGCSDDDSSTVGVGSVSYTGCKQEGVGVGRNGGLAGVFGDEYIEYYGKGDGRLFVRHVNAVFNCANERIEVSSAVADGLIVVSESGTDNTANCVCPFDVSYEIGSLVSGSTYTIKIVKDNLDCASFTFTYPSKGRVDIK